MSEAPAHGAEGPHADVADEPRHLGQERSAPSDLRKLLQFVVAG